MFYIFKCPAYNKRRFLNVKRKKGGSTQLNARGSTRYFTSLIDKEARLLGC